MLVLESVSGHHMGGTSLNFNQYFRVFSLAVYCLLAALSPFVGVSLASTGAGLIFPASSREPAVSLCGFHNP